MVSGIGLMMDDVVRVSGSLRRRLMISLISGAAILSVLLFFVVRHYAAQIAQDSQDSILRASVSSILDAAVIRDGQVEVDFPYASFSMLDTDRDDRVFYGIYQDRRLLSGYADLSLPEGRIADEAQFSTALVDGTVVRQASATRMLIGASERTRIAVTVAQTQDALAGTLQDISRTVALFCALFFGLVTALSVVAASATIDPLSRLATSVARRGPQDLRPFEKQVPSELVPLVSSLNRLMGRLDQSLTRSEDFIAEAAHRVRTPLATVRTYAESTLQRVSRQENRDALRAMVRAIDESSRAATQLLDHAMITFRADHLERKDLDLGALVEDLVMRLSPIAEMKDVDLVFETQGPVAVSGDEILIQNAIRNLIDNALKYAPHETVVTIRVEHAPRPAVSIIDQGPGFPTQDMDGLTVRFARGDNAGGIIGSGLGLTIAKDVAVAHDGALTLSNTEKGGACVTLSF